MIVPVSMSSVQKEIYKGILSTSDAGSLLVLRSVFPTGSNLDLLRTLAQSVAGAKITTAGKKSNLNNMLMQLRKYVCIHVACCNVLNDF